MNQQERRIHLIQELLKENKAYREIKIPETSGEQKQLLRGLMNIRMPGLAGEEFLKIQDEYLQEEIRRKGITETDSLVPVRDGIYLWQGDITTLRCDAIVNAATVRCWAASARTMAVSTMRSIPFPAYSFGRIVGN